MEKFRSRGNTYTSEDKDIGITLNLFGSNIKFSDTYDRLEIKNLTDGVVIIATNQNIQWKRLPNLDKLKEGIEK